MRGRIANLRAGIRITVRALALIAGARPWVSALFAASVLMVVLLPVVQPLLLQQVVDRLSGAAAGGVLLLAIGYALTVAVPALLEPAQDTFGANLEDRAVGQVDRRLMEASRKLVDLTRIERPAHHDRVRLHWEIARMLPGFFFFGRGAVGSAVTALGLLVVLAQLHPLVPVALGLTGTCGSRPDSACCTSSAWSAGSPTSPPAPLMGRSAPAMSRCTSTRSSSSRWRCTRCRPGSARCSSCTCTPAGCSSSPTPPVPGSRWPPTVHRPPPRSSAASSSVTSNSAIPRASTPCSRVST